MALLSTADTTGRQGQAILLALSVEKRFLMSVLYSLSGGHGSFSGWLLAPSVTLDSYLVYDAKLSAYYISNLPRLVFIPSFSL